MTSIHHKEKWQKLSLAEQLGNIGSELSRINYFIKTKDEILKEKSIIQIFELIVLTLEDRRWRFRLKELSRFKEVLADVLTGKNFYKTSLAKLNDYCLDFAMMARKEK